MTTPADKFAEHQAALETAVLEREAERAAAQAEQERLLSLRGKTTFDPKTQDTFFSLNQQKRAQEAAEREAAEVARLAAITPRQIWISSLSYQEQQRVSKWEAANPGLKFPMPVGFAEQVLAAKAE